VEEGEGKNQRIKSSDFILTLGLYRGQVEGQAKNPSAEVGFVVYSTTAGDSVRPVAHRKKEKQ
jgi:hypothetical protein